VSPADDRGETAPPSSLQRTALIVGAVALIVCTLYGIFSPASFFRAYLTAFEFWLSVSLGCMVVMMIRHVTGGVWGLWLRPIFEAAAILIPLLAILFLPLLLGLSYVFPWRPNFVGGSILADPNFPESKRIWFELPLFLGRAAGYFIIWTAFAFFLNLGPRGPGVALDEQLSRRLRAASAIGLIVYGLTITCASIDWSMSLDPNWFSTIYGAMYGTGQMLAGFAFAVLAAALLAQKNTPRQLLRDSGNLLLAFTMLWAYLSFSQYLLIWAANLPDETAYYQPRLRDGWEWVALALVISEFALPFLLLLLMRVKITPRLLAVVAGISLAAHFLDILWLTVPAYTAYGGTSWDMIILAPALLVGLGGVWVSLFLWRLQQRPFYSAAAMHLEVPTYE
jgi:hypothetical protein